MNTVVATSGSCTIECSTLVVVPSRLAVAYECFRGQSQLGYHLLDILLR